MLALLLSHIERRIYGPRREGVRGDWINHVVGRFIRSVIISRRI